MNRDLFREISLRYLSYKTCKRLSLAFKNGNVLTRQEKLSKYCCSRGIEYCIKNSYYDSFLELYRALKANNRKSKLTLERLLELARDANAILIFDFLWNGYNLQKKIIYNHKFIDRILIQSNLDFLEYFYRLYTDKYPQQKLSIYYNRFYYLSLINPEQIDFEKYDWLNRLQGGTGNYVVLSDCLNQGKIKRFNRLMKLDLPSSIVRRAYFNYFLYLVNQHVSWWFPLYLLLFIVLSQAIAIYVHLINAIPSLLFWLYISILLQIERKNLAFLRIYQRFVFGLLCFLIFSSLSLACLLLLFY